MSYGWTEYTKAAPKIEENGYTTDEVTPEVVEAIATARDLYPEALDNFGTDDFNEEYARGTLEFLIDFFGLGGDNHSKGEALSLVYGIEGQHW